MSKDVINNVNLKIKEATSVLKGVVHETPLSRSMTLSRITGAGVYLKLENLQKTGSFKVRGAYYAIWKRLREGIDACVTASSGNHAQGVAFSASSLGVRSIVVMPVHTPFYKVQATRGYGAEVVLHGDTYDEAYEKALELSSSLKIPLIHPFDDYDVIAGQGTIGVEIYNELDSVDAAIVPVGGGGLISGIAVALKKFKPEVKVIGVQPEGAPAIYRSFKERKKVSIEKIYTIADGVAVKVPGEKTLTIIDELVDDMVLVDDYEIARAMFLLLERAKLVVEPAGALSVAALLSNKVSFKGKNVVAVISGGNVDMALLSRIIERGLYIEGRVAKIRGRLRDRPGELKKVIDVIASHRFNIVSIEHERSNPLIHPGMAEVTLGVEVPDAEALRKVMSKLKERGLEFNVVSG